MAKVYYVLIIIAMAVTVFLSGFVVALQKERGKILELCEKFSRVQITDLNNGKVLLKKTLLCQNIDAKCEDRVKIISGYVKGHRVTHALPSSFSIDPYQEDVQIGIVNNKYIDDDGHLIDVIDFSAKPSALKSVLTSFIFSGRYEKRCSEIQGG